MADEPILLERHDDGVVVLTFNDPERRNAMTRAMGEALASRVAELGGDRELRAVVLTGAGRAFCAGGDLDFIQAMADAGRADPAGPTRRQNREAMRSFYGLFLSVRQIPCPTVAALNGAAVGAGLCVALACDVRIAARDARLGLNFARLGIHPGMGATWTLPRIVGPAHAADLLLTGRLVEGAEAERMGLVNRATDRDRVLPEALEMAQQIAGAAPAAVRGTRAALERALDASLEDQLSFEADRQAECYETADLQEGLRAAREKRAAEFRGK
ncbi:MAG: enoyl-CoA hydratase/isomerase family protein [Deltaproteobacteria bacterium]|nr:enoyl-CoA hydratase/isomerase family protein [Deltaproteobacteria bacterium]